MTNLEIQNKALLLKHLHKFYNKHDLPWVKSIWNKYYDTRVPHMGTGFGSFWSKDVTRFVTEYRGVATAQMGTGDTILFWKDSWNGNIFCYKYPRLFSYATNQDVSDFQYKLSCKKMILPLSSIYLS